MASNLEEVSESSSLLVLCCGLLLVLPIIYLRSRKCSGYPVGWFDTAAFTKVGKSGCSSPPALVTDEQEPIYDLELFHGGCSGCLLFFSALCSMKAAFLPYSISFIPKGLLHILLPRLCPKFPPAPHFHTPTLTSQPTPGSASNPPFGTTSARPSTQKPSI